MGTIALAVTASPLDRALAFVREYLDAPSSADIDIRIGASDTGVPAVMASINGKHHGFTAAEARTLARVFEKTMHDVGTRAASDAGLPNIILALRVGADKAERAGTGDGGQ